MQIRAILLTIFLNSSAVSRVSIFPSTTNVFTMTCDTGEILCNAAGLKNTGTRKLKLILTMTPLHLSEIVLRNEAAAKIIPRDCYGWHKVLWRFFPNQQSRDFLYRVDFIPNGLRIYIVSGKPVQVPLGMPADICRSREIPESFLSHANYRFKLRANPTRKIKTDIRAGGHKENGQRVPITDLGELAAWFQRKGKDGGFSIPGLDSWPEESCPLEILPENRNTFCKPGLDNAYHCSVQFSGLLHVTNTEQFQTTFRKGIGSAKSFGFGLLLLQPIISFNSTN